MMARALVPFEQSVSLLKLFFTANSAARHLKSLTKPPLNELIEPDGERPVGHFTLQDATYAYPNRNALALRGVSLELKPGESLGIIGPNGAGKSTLAALIAGAIDPRSGSVNLDGLGSAKWQRGLERPAIGYAGTQPALFEGTVHENIVRFGEFSLMSAAQAAMKIGVHDVLSDLPNGYETRVAADGQGLSSREARAVAFARAVHGSPRIVVFDEPELGLDAAAEKRLMGLLADLKKSGTSLVIATQQPRLLALTEKVAVLKKGNLEMFGPAAEVMQKLKPARAPAPAEGPARAQANGATPAQPTMTSARPRPAPVRSQAPILSQASGRPSTPQASRVQPA